jgi:hypothetical protein
MPPPRQFWRQQAGGLLVFVKCLLEPYLIAKGMTNIGRGIEFMIIVDHPVGVREGGCDHLYCSHLEGLEREGVDK